MRARLVYIVVAAVLVIGLAALNWPEVTRSSHVDFGVASADAPLGAIMFGAFLLTLLVFLLSSAVVESRHLILRNRHHRELQTQRDLAERAEASRFTDLRHHIDATLRETRQRDSLSGGEFERSMLQSHRELRTLLDNMNRTLLARLADLEARIDGRAPVRETAAADTAAALPARTETGALADDPLERVDVRHHRL